MHIARGKKCCESEKYVDRLSPVDYRESGRRARGTDLLFSLQLQRARVLISHHLEVDPAHRGHTRINLNFACSPVKEVKHCLNFSH